MPDTGAVPVEPRPAASVIIVRDAAAGAAEPIEVYMIRRQRSMKFLGGFYAFPGGKVDPGDAAPAVLAGCCGLDAGDAAPAVLAGCCGLDAADAARCFPGHDALPPLAFWVAAVRELLEESGVLLACDGAGRIVAAPEPTVGLPAGQTPRLYTEETSEGFWIHPAAGYRRFLAKEMAMAEPAEYGLAYIAQFRSVDELWAACDDNREKFTGIVDRIEFQFWKDFDWRAGRWTR
ncbi:MAG: hypothetical protein DME02_11395 [Candidatus Rokuibacteriota bacterium]|nr:MAG: hypothetical protein DME02_11395 [Candidatus Rokubacteria bacterium]